MTVHSIDPTPRRVASRALLALLLGAGMHAARAQSPAPLPEVNLPLHRAGSVAAIVRQPDGGIVIGGNFRSVNGVARANLARLRPDGTLDPDWNPGANNGVSLLASDASGAIYAGGGFTQIGGVARARLARLAGSGSGAVDPGWAPQPNDQVFALALDPAGPVFVGGAFTSIGGAARAGLAKLSASGSGAADANWNPAPNGLVTDMQMGTGALFVAGSFTSVGTQARAGLARLDTGGTGAADASWNPAPAGNVFALALGPGGDLFVGGNFSSIGGAPRSNLAKLSPGGAGSADPAWNPAPNNPVGLLAFDAAGALYAKGSFNQIAGQTRSFVAKLSSSGAAVADPGFNPTGSSGASALVIGAAGQVHVGGSDFVVNGSGRAGLVTLDASGALQPAIDVETAGEVRALARQSDGGVVLGGQFRRAGALRRDNLARLRPDGTLDPDFDPSFDRQVSGLTVDANDSIFVAGPFTRVDGVARNDIAKLSANGELDTGWSSSPGGFVNSMSLDGNGSLFLAGSFSVVGSSPRNGLAKLSASTGALDPVWNPEATGFVARVVSDGNGSVYVGGGFGAVGGATRAGIAKLASGGTGAADPLWNPGANGFVSALALAHGSLYAAGSFTSIGGVANAGFAKLALDGSGSVDATFNPSPGGTVHAIAPDAGGVLHLGGLLFSVNGTTRRGVAKIAAGSGALDPNWNPDAPPTVNAFVADDNGAIYVGGAFTRVGGIARDGLAKLRTHYERGYLAGPDGSISGDTGQLVQHGASSTAVTAVPDAGFHFVQWSDGSSANPRVDANVTADASVSASFANDAPQIAGVGANPATVFEAESSSVIVAASDREDATLVYRFDCDDDGSFELGPQPGASASCTFPTPGSHRVNVRVSDIPGESADGFVTVVVNDSLAQATLALPATVDEDAAVPLSVGTSVPSSGESVFGVSVDCDFDGLQFDTDFSVSLPLPAITCPASPIGGFVRGIAVRAYDDTFELGPVVSASVPVAAINDAPRFVIGADLVLDEDLPFALDGWIAQFAPGPDEASDEVSQVLSFQVIANSAPALFASGPGVDAQGRIALQPAADANGDASLLLRLCDDGASNAPNDNCSDAQVFEIAIAPVNDAPTAALLALPREPAGSSGMREVAGFASFDAGPGDEDTTQSVDAYLIDTVLDPDAVLQPASLALDEDGTLRYALTGASGSAAVALRVRDDGGTARGGIDTSATLLFTLTVGAAADLQVALDNGSTRLVDGQTTLYALVIANAGPNPVLGATLTDAIPATLAEPLWTCVQALSTATCPPASAGEGPIALQFDLDVDRFLRFDVIARVELSAGNTAIHIAEVALPEGIAAIDASNDRAVDQDPILAQGVFGHGFESPSPAALTATGAQRALQSR
jgi:uncharacterized repeat protein (TIGR01451 family)